METIKDIFAVASILIKFERCDILEDQALFIEFINELGFRTPRNLRFTPASFKLMMDRVSDTTKSMLIDDFNAAHESINRQMCMYTR